MRFLADENISPDVVARLRVTGSIVVHMQEVAPGTSDADVAERAETEGLILLTSDKDFGELVYARGKALAGVVLFRLRGMPYALRSKRMTDVLVSDVELQHFFTVVEPERIRQRPMPRKS